MDSSLFFAPKGTIVLPPITTPYQKRKRPIIIDEAPAPKKAKNTTSSNSAGNKQKTNVSGNRKRIIHKPKPAFLGEQRTPPKHGELEIPDGTSDALEGLAFVQTGLGTFFTAQEISDIIFDHGGVERTAVSGKTSYLVAGFEMEDGRKITEGAQHKAAVKKKVKIISDRDLLNMVLEGLKKDENAKKE